MNARVTHRPLTSCAIDSPPFDERGIDCNQIWGFIHQQTVITSFLTQMEIFDPALLKQLRTVAHYSQLMARSLVFTPEDKDKLFNSALLYDVGMMGVDRRIIEKKGKLNPKEREIIRAHPLNGVKILSPFPFFREILPIIMHHHEWYDGTGYPEGLMGEDIPLMSRIIMIVDAFVALTTDRPYRSALPINKAFGIIKRNKGRQFDPQLVPHFTKVVKEDFYNNIIYG
jgi:HD-GYP domain-containing protein (c-di-GMP phosphodiesterase class II)